MNAETFCEHFATFADAPNGVEKLRGMILQLAIHGKLVAQCSSEESATVLLETIARRKIDHEGKEEEQGRKRRSARTSDVQNKQSFSIPRSWEIATIDDLVLNISNGCSQPQTKSITEFPVTRIETISHGVVNRAKVGFVEALSADEIQRFRLQDGDILFSHINSEAHLGKTAVFHGTEFLLHGTNLLLIRLPVDLVVPRYFDLLMKYLRVTGYFASIAQHAIHQASINQTKVRSTHVPLAPLAEQRRIVEKVDQLLGLCDELAARQASQREKRQRLVGATLERLVSPQTSRHLACRGGLTASAPLDSDTTGAKANEPPGQARWRVMQDDAHRLRNHFDQLFDTPTTIPQLRQTILQLAVQGQLVPQNPNDESASHLLEQIKGERLKLIAEKKISKSEPTPPVDESQILFSVPETWSWVRLPDVCHVITDGEHLTPQYAEAGIPMLSAKHVGSHSILLEDFKLVSHATAAKCWSRCCPDERDILVVSRGGGVGRTIISGRRDYCLMGSVLLFKLASQVDERFLCYFLNSTQGNEKLRTTSGASAQQAIYIAHLKRDYVVPLPPLAEQKRIVTKVTELLSLCDALEAKLSQAESASTQLLSAAVHHLLQKP